MKVLAFFAHPDDEAYAAGGLLAFAAQCGARVEVLAATRGEAGVDRAAHAGGRSLGQRRTRELGASCRALGAEDPRFLDLADGAVEAERAAELLAPHLASIGPDVIVTLGEDGAYGHRDHLACTAAVARLEPMATVLHAVFPRGLFTPVARSLQKLGVVSSSPDRLGVDADAVDLRLALDGTLAQQKEAALAAHASQLRRGDPQSFLIPGLVAPLLREEWFQLASGSMPSEQAELARWLAA